MVHCGDILENRERERLRDLFLIYILFTKTGVNRRFVFFCTECVCEHIPDPDRSQQADRGRSLRLRSCQVFIVDTFFPCCGSKYIEIGSGFWSLAQFESGSRSGSWYRIMLSILKEKSRKCLFSNKYLFLNVKKIMSPEEICMYS